jgi:hypothetical protein
MAVFQAIPRAPYSREHFLRIRQLNEHSVTVARLFSDTPRRLYSDTPFEIRAVSLNLLAADIAKLPPAPQQAFTSGANGYALHYIFNIAVRNGGCPSSEIQMSVHDKHRRERLSELYRAFQAWPCFSQTPFCDTNLAKVPPHTRMRRDHATFWSSRRRDGSRVNPGLLQVLGSLQQRRGAAARQSSRPMSPAAVCSFSFLLVLPWFVHEHREQLRARPLPIGASHSLWAVVHLYSPMCPARPCTCFASFLNCLVHLSITARRRFCHVLICLARRSNFSDALAQ